MCTYELCKVGIITLKLNFIILLVTTNIISTFYEYFLDFLQLICEKSANIFCRYSLHEILSRFFCNCSDIDLAMNEKLIVKQKLPAFAATVAS